MIKNSLSGLMKKRVKGSPRAKMSCENKIRSLSEHSARTKMAG